MTEKDRNAVRSQQKMVRRVQTCISCRSCFIALANFPSCETCVSDQATGFSSEKSVFARADTSINLEEIDAPRESGAEFDQNILDGDTVDQFSSDEEGSEGHDEVQCTQLLDDEDSDPENDKADTNAVNHETSHPSRTEGSLESNHQVPPTNISREKSIPVPRAAVSDDICFICGVSLVKLKRRIDHIKRCAKKHGVTGKDVQVNTDQKLFVDEEDASSGLNKASLKNPYAKDSNWHGDASLALELAKSEPQHTSSADNVPADKNQGGTSKQAPLTAFLNNPVRSLNNVLIAGARRLTKTAEIKASAKDAQGNATKFSRGRKRKRGAWTGASSAFKTCPKYKIIPGTDFVCDGFHYAKSTLSSTYFLTHFHADHYGGITKGWDTGIIYCSEPTAKLVAQQLGVDKKYLHPLPMDTPVVVESKGKPVTITLMDANHCPGAVMFLFEVGKRSILHVGDFRWNRDLMMQHTPLRKFASNEKILDELFLDTTYCNPKFELPSQQEAIDAVSRAFEQEHQRCKGSTLKTLHLFGAYTIGKERMYLSIAERFKMKVYVDRSRYRILSALNWPAERMSLLTTEKEDADIWVVPLGDINMKNLPEYLPKANSKPFAKQYSHVVGYRPTGWSMGSKPSSSVLSTRKSGNVVVHSVAYSEHSSFPELLDCLACLKPQRIVPTVAAKTSESQVQILLKGLREKQTKLPFLES